MENITATELLIGLLIITFIIPCAGALLLMWLTNKTIDKKIEVIKGIVEKDDAE